MALPSGSSKKPRKSKKSKRKSLEVHVDGVWHGDASKGDHSGVVMIALDDVKENKAISAKLKSMWKKSALEVTFLCSRYRNFPRVRFSGQKPNYPLIQLVLPGHVTY